MITQIIPWVSISLYFGTTCKYDHQGKKAPPCEETPIFKMTAQMSCFVSTFFSVDNDRREFHNLEDDTYLTLYASQTVKLGLETGLDNWVRKFGCDAFSGGMKVKCAHLS